MRYRVHLRSVPGPMEQYNGHVDVTVSSRAPVPPHNHALFHAAVAQLRRTSFPDRDASCWRFEKAELIG